MTSLYDSQNAFILIFANLCGPLEKHEGLPLGHAHRFENHSATYGLGTGSGPPSKIIRPAAPIQVVVTVWPA